MSTDRDVSEVVHVDCAGILSVTSEAAETHEAAAARSYSGLADELRAVRLYVAGSELQALDRRHAEGTTAKTALVASEVELRSSLTQLDAEVLVHGAIDRVELWNPAAWAERVLPEESWLLDDEA